MYKQIGNAVSPQLTKALVRSIFRSHSAALGINTSPPLFSHDLRNFAEFYKDLNEVRVALLPYVHAFIACLLIYWRRLLFFTGSLTPGTVRVAVCATTDSQR